MSAAWAGRMTFDPTWDDGYESALEQYQFERFDSKVAELLRSPEWLHDNAVTDMDAPEYIPFAAAMADGDDAELGRIIRRRAIEIAKSQAPELLEREFNSIRRD